MRLLKTKEKSRKVHLGDMIVYPMRTDILMRTDIYRGKVNSFSTPWAAIEVIDCRPNSNLDYDIRYLRGSNPPFSYIFESKEEALLYAESLGKTPTVLDFEPILTKIQTTGTVRERVAKLNRHVRKPYIIPMSNAIPRKILCPQCFSELVLEEHPSGEIRTRCPKCGPLGKARPPEEKDRKAFWKRCPTLMSDDPFASCPFPS